MRAVIQRAKEAAVFVEGVREAAIGKGLVVFLGVAEGDDATVGRGMADRITHLRVFPDDRGKLGLDLAQVRGAVLLVPQFTVLGDLSHGHRPSFQAALAPERARALWRYVGEVLAETGLAVASGAFGADMEVTVRGDGPLTLILDHPRPASVRLGF